MSWTVSDLLRIGIIVYVGIWAYLRFREWNANIKSNTDVFQVATYERKSKGFKSLGWVVVLVVFAAGSIFFPEIYIVSQHEPAYTDDTFEESLIVHESFNIERKYVLFYYNGHRCGPFDKYISNETDSTLVLYSTKLFDGAYMYFSGYTSGYFKEVPANSLIKWNNTLDNNWFKKPYGTKNSER